jgi:hypothetical protein
LELPTTERCNYTTTNFLPHGDKIGQPPTVFLASAVSNLPNLSEERKFKLFELFFLVESLSIRVVSATKGVPMQIHKLRAVILASAFTVVLSSGYALAQDGAKKDLKAAGTDTKDATKEAGHGVATGTKKVYHKTASGTKTAADKTADGTKTVGKDVGHGTKVAAKDTAHGTKTVGKDIGHGTKVAAKDTAHGTEKVGDKIAGKPDPH